MDQYESILYSRILDVFFQVVEELGSLKEELNMTLNEKEGITKNRIPSFEEFLKESKKHGKGQSKEQFLSLIKEQMVEYEKKYQMSTIDFIPRYEAGEFEMDDRYLNHELFDWSSAHETYQRMTSEEGNRGEP